MSDAATASAIERLAADIGGPFAGTRDAVRLHLADTVGAWVAGAGTADGRRLIAHGGGATDAAVALATHCAVARLSEIDDIHIGAMITPGAIIVPAALCIAREINAPAVALAPAIAAGYEAMVRLGRAIDGPSILYRGIWPSYIAAPVGVAAVAARLLNLNTVQTAHALALALSLSSPGVGHAASGRWFAVGQAARNGLAAARAAQSGFTGDLKLLDGGFFANVYAITPALPDMTSPAILQTAFKPWCAARQTMAATQAFREVLQVVPADDVLAVEAFVLPPHHRMVDHGVADGDRMSYLTSLPYQLAAAAFAPDAGFDVAKAAPTLTGAMRALMGKVTVTADPGLLGRYPQTWPARISVTALSGRYDRDATHVPGDPERPLDRAALLGKFRRLVGNDADALFALALGALDEDGAAATLVATIEERAQRSASDR